MGEGGGGPILGAAAHSADFTALIAALTLSVTIWLLGSLVGAVIIIGTLYCCCWSGNSAGDDRLGGGDEGGVGYCRMERVLMTELQAGPKV